MYDINSIGSCLEGDCVDCGWFKGGVVCVVYRISSCLCIARCDCSLVVVEVQSLCFFPGV